MMYRLRRNFRAAQVSDWAVGLAAKRHGAVPYAVLGGAGDGGGGGRVVLASGAQLHHGIIQLTRLRQF